MILFDKPKLITNKHFLTKIIVKKYENYLPDTPMSPRGPISPVI